MERYPPTYDPYKLSLKRPPGLVGLWDENLCYLLISWFIITKFFLHHHLASPLIGFSLWQADQVCVWEQDILGGTLPWQWGLRKEKYNAASPHW